MITGIVMWIQTQEKAGSFGTGHKVMCQYNRVSYSVLFHVRYSVLFVCLTVFFLETPDLVLLWNGVNGNCGQWNLFKGYLYVIQRVQWAEPSKTFYMVPPPALTKMRPAHQIWPARGNCQSNHPWQEVGGNHHPNPIKPGWSCHSYHLQPFTISK